MAREDEILRACRLFKENKPHTAFEEFNKIEVGYFAVLKYLLDFSQEVSSKEISTYLGVSSARMTILLKKLENKKLIIKSNAPNDARSINVSLTQEGVRYALDLRNKMFCCMQKIIDEIGFEELESVINNVNIIRKILNQNKIENMEED